jgi:hypothetical protein
VSREVFYIASLLLDTFRRTIPGQVFLTRLKICSTASKVSPQRKAGEAEEWARGRRQNEIGEVKIGDEEKEIGIKIIYFVELSQGAGSEHFYNISSWHCSTHYSAGRSLKALA